MSPCSPARSAQGIRTGRTLSQSKTRPSPRCRTRSSRAVESGLRSERIVSNLVNPPPPQYRAMVPRRCWRRCQPGSPGAVALCQRQPGHAGAAFVRSSSRPRKFPDFNAASTASRKSAFGAWPPGLPDYRRHVRAIDPDNEPYLTLYLPVRSQSRVGVDQPICRWPTMSRRERGEPGEPGDRSGQASLDLQGCPAIGRCGR